MNLVLTARGLHLLLTGGNCFVVQGCHSGCHQLHAAEKEIVRRCPKSKNLRVGVAVLGNQEPLEGDVGIISGSLAVTAGGAEAAAHTVHATAGNGGGAVGLQSLTMKTNVWFLQPTK